VNVPSAKTAIAYGCRQEDAYTDEVNGKTLVFSVSKETTDIT